MDIAQSLISAASGLIGVALGGWLTFRNAGKEKLIDLRRSSYGAILFDLSEAEKILDTAAEYISEGGWDRYFDSDAQKKHDQKIADRMGAIDRRLRADYLIISDRFRSLYEDFQRDSAVAEDIGYWEEDDTFEKAVRKHRPLLLDQARAETMR